MRFRAALTVALCLPAAVFGADPPALHQQLAKESPADLARAAREKGDAGRGAVLFFQPFLACAKCHDADAGTHLGPDLGEGLCVGLEPALQGEDADHQPRFWSRPPFSWRVPISIPGMASPS